MIFVYIYFSNNHFYYYILSSYNIIMHIIMILMHPLNYLHQKVSFLELHIIFFISEEFLHIFTYSPQCSCLHVHYLIWSFNKDSFLLFPGSFSFAVFLFFNEIIYFCHFSSLFTNSWTIFKKYILNTIHDYLTRIILVVPLIIHT